MQDVGAPCDSAKPYQDLAKKTPEYYVMICESFVYSFKHYLRSCRPAVGCLDTTIQIQFDLWSDDLSKRRRARSSGKGESPLNAYAFAHA